MHDALLKYRKVIILVSQVVLLTVTYYISFLLRFDFNIAPSDSAIYRSSLLVTLLVRLALFSYFGLFRGWWRYAGMSDLMDIGKATLISEPLIVAGVALTI